MKIHEKRDAVVHKGILLCILCVAVKTSLLRSFGLLVDMIGPPSKHQKMDQLMMMTIVALISLFLTAVVFNKHCRRTKLFCFGIVRVDASIR